MFAHIKQYISSSINASFLYRGIALFALLPCVVLGVKAEVSQETHITGIEEGVVYLNDLEDHNWSYYQTTSDTNPICSPNPRNVKITYQGGGIEDAENGNANAAIGIDAPETTFEYLITLEKVDGKYPYTTIPNPFSKRPSKQFGDNPKQFYGFAGWRVIRISEGTTITDGSTSYTTDEGQNIIHAETEIVFNFTSEYSENCISAEIVLEAVWEEASVVYCNKLSELTQYVAHDDLVSDTYEKNFIVIRNMGTNNDENPYQTSIENQDQKPVTIMIVEPDGSADYRTYQSGGSTKSRYLKPSSITLFNDLKIEYANMRDVTTINANAHNLILGRGIKHPTSTTTRCATTIRGINESKTEDLDYQLRIESGIYTNLYFLSANTGNNVIKCSGTSKRIGVILGNDYDRAKNSDGFLKINSEIRMGTDMAFTKNEFDDSSLNVVVKSGTYNASQTTPEEGSAGQSFYISMSSEPTLAGLRSLIVEGGTFWNIAGGVDTNGTSGTRTDKTSVYIRIKGGIVRGAIYGGGAYAEGHGNRKLVFTGGTVGGWIAAGCNGTQSSGGRTYGSSYVYVGGNTIVNNQYEINGAQGGQVFGAGKGYSTSTGTSGEMTYGTTVVVADNASIAGDVYGGGFYGYAKEGLSSSSNVYVLGGTIGGNVYGGSNMKGGAPTNITIAGGTVNGDVYGGSNTKGEIASTSITMTGGTVGSDNTGGNIFGGGNQAPVKGDTNVTISGGEVKQNVYGGGNKAAVSGTTNVVIGQ